ncbi:uncharacterized protein [Pyrus communis]|uniref:uncharacterized protein n=1 Tax=Pyrus communis TaxID=23211 RepID=UPI0035C06144
MASKFELIKIERLVNHRIWKRMVAYLSTHKKTMYTIQDEAPVEGSRGFTKWEKDNEMAHAIILNHMEDDLIPLYEGYTTTKEIMDILEDKYSPKSQTYIQLLLEKYNGTHMSENDSMVDHVTKMEIMARDLSNVGHPIFDEMQSLYF